MRHLTNKSYKKLKKYYVCEILLIKKILMLLRIKMKKEKKKYMINLMLLITFLNDLYTETNNE